MKKLTLVTLLVLSFALSSCWKSKPPVVVGPITTDTPIVTKAQAAKVCEPFVKYLECSLEKAAPARKKVNEDILKETQRKIENDAPDRVAQQCDTYIKILKENPTIAFKNGCTLQESPAVPAK